MLYKIHGLKGCQTQKRQSMSCRPKQVFTLQWLFCYLEHILRWAFFSVILFLFATFCFKLEPNLLWIWSWFISVKKFCRLLSSNLFSWPKKYQFIPKRNIHSFSWTNHTSLTLMNKDRKTPDEISYLDWKC